jgi:RNA polymerase sigma-70 factor, ECF subfamily
VTISDEALMLDFQRGSREAFEELFARYRGPLYGFFRRRLDNSGAARAEDLAQETFLAVIRTISRYKPQALVRTYLYAIALNLLSAERRKKAPESIEESVAEPALEDSSETALWVRQALRELGPTEREILMLREFEQLSYAEISDLLKLPVNTVRSRLFRARMALKERLEPRLKFNNTAERKPEFPAMSSQSEGEEA